MASFTSAFLGEVQHPKNVLREYLTAFGNKYQADILSWLDGWTKTKRAQDKEDWVRVVTSKLAETLGRQQSNYLHPPEQVARNRRTRKERGTTLPL